MTLKELKEIVFDANLDLVRHHLVLFTWGNASGIDRERELIVIKPSGVSYQDLTAEMLPVLDLQGNIVEGRLNPSSDTPTHLVLYRSFPDIGGVVHTHSTYATAWSQAQRDIPANGTTHADYFYREIPCTRSMTQNEIFGNYEAETGNVIVECFRTRQINPVHVPGVLVANHGPFTWGISVHRAVENAVVLEEVARIMSISYSLNPVLPMNPFLIEKHFSRKHGEHAYYGQ
ncbi:MAG: L-ribulose-5-phosphate 4-epimerase [Planctomycetaceae bacterium]|jgi:L-ribulose-5-phosphate 4-epimerase|nr:L-ribulose-5-phosphate 4-epimerase [Planctomycetaceae bacterium]